MPVLLAMDDVFALDVLQDLNDLGHEEAGFWLSEGLSLPEDVAE